MSGAYLDESKSQTHLNLHSDADEQRLVAFPPVEPEDVIRLREDFLHASHVYRKYLEGQPKHQLDREHISLIPDVISRVKISLEGSPSEEATALAEIFREVPFPRKIPARALIPPVVRSFRT